MGATGRGSSKSIPPGSFAVRVDCILYAAFRFRGLPDIIGHKIRTFAEHPYVWQDGHYFDCSVCCRILPLAHTPVHEHCRETLHKRLCEQLRRPSQVLHTTVKPKPTHSDSGRRVNHELTEEPRTRRWR